MTSRLADSRMYEHLWSTPRMRAIFSEEARLQRWLDILVALARAQAELGLIPRDAAGAVAAHADVRHLDVDLITQHTRRTGHSMLGLIAGLRAVLPEAAREHVYYGATVQDVTDTWTALAMRDVAAIAWHDLWALEGVLLGLAERHRDTVMVGRTHGQAGAVITFGWKVATWADEVRRHLDRLRGARDRWFVGQLGGAVGTAAFFGANAPALRERFCDLLGLDTPRISWLTTRDRVADFGCTLAQVGATLGRIGNEIYALARSAVGELREPIADEAVSSITMPHKRNPEHSEHLVTLARLAAPQAQVLLDGMIGEHERDGRSWKAEWVALPEICLLVGTALEVARGVLGNLDVDVAAMAANVEAHRHELASERLLVTLTERIGKHSAQQLLQAAFAVTRETGTSLDRVVNESVWSRGHLAGDEVRAAFEAAPDVGAASGMVDAVVAGARAQRAGESAEWP